jgi:hypothetical protein
MCLKKDIRLQDETPHDDTCRKKIGFEILYFKAYAGIWNDDRKGILISLRKMKEMMDETFPSILALTSMPVKPA